MITKEKLYAIGAVVLCLAGIYMVSKSFGSVVLALASMGGGWFLKGKFGNKVEEAIQNLPKK